MNTPEREEIARTENEVLLRMNEHGAWLSHVYDAHDGPWNNGMSISFELLDQYSQKHKHQALRELANKLKDVMSQFFSENTSHFLPKPAFDKSYREAVDKILNQMIGGKE